jgi:hypothetical protein
VAEHYTRNTLGCTVWCKKCDGFTQHRVEGGRRGPCLTCIAKAEEKIAADGGWSKAQLAKRKKNEQERQNPKLF